MFQFGCIRQKKLSPTASSTDVALEALRAYRERATNPNRQALTKFAQINRVDKVMRPYLEALL